MGTKVKVQNNNFTKYLDASGPVDSIKKQKQNHYLNSALCY